MSSRNHFCGSEGESLDHAVQESESTDQKDRSSLGNNRAGHKSANFSVLNLVRYR
jgi:hypothetical protein